MAPGRRATIKDVARAAGVSVTTVSLVLNRTGSIGAEVRERVLAAVKEVSYRPNRLAMATRTGRSRTIGLVLPDLRNPFFPELAEAISEAALAEDYVVLLGGGLSSTREHESLNRLAAQGVDGFCWCPSSLADLPKEIGLAQPLVVIDRPLPGYDTVTSNFSMAGTLIAEEIARCGLNRIGMVTAPLDLPGAAERLRAFLDGLAGRGEIVWRVNNPYGIALDEDVRGLLRQGDVDAIVCANDMIAIGVIDYLHSIGTVIPDNVAVIGFDDIPWARLANPPITTVRQNVVEIGRAAINLLLARIEEAERPLHHLEVDVSMEQRQSTPDVR